MLETHHDQLAQYAPAAVVCVVVLFAAWLVRRAVARVFERRTDSDALALLQNQMNATTQQTAQQMEQLRQSLQTISTQMTQSLDQTNKSVGDRLDGAARVIQNVHKQLGELTESSKHIYDVGKDIASLQQTLRSPKLRGNISELFLGDLLAQILPTHHFKLQFAFRGGETVDAVVILKAGMVPVDAKFPLENFKRITDAQDDDARRTARKTFTKDVKTHVDTIAAKYIRTDEGTFDFALMYIPAENVYYETIIKDDETGSTSLLAYALGQRVIPVSPNSFYAYLQTILLGLKGMSVEERAREIVNNLSRLQKEFERFNEPFRLVGKHLENTRKQYDDALSRLGKIEAKIEQIDGVVQGVDGAERPGLLPEKEDEPTVAP